MAKHHFVVLVEQASWRVVHFVGMRFEEIREFGFTEGDLTALLHWCQPFPQAAFSFLTNLPDEHYHIETLPHVSGAIGRQLLLRKVSAWPFAQGLHAIVRLDSVRTLRREDRFLFTALGHPGLSSWLTRLAPPLPNLQGVYTQALSMPHWLPQLPKNIMHRLCIQCTKHQVRISYFQKKRLFFSRLIPRPQITLSALDDGFSHIAHEAAQLRLMFIQQRWVQESDVFEVMWLGEVPTDVELMKKHLPSGSVWARISMPELQHLLGYKRLPDGIDVMDWAAMQPVLHGSALPNLAPPKMLLTNSMIRIKRYLHGAGVVMTALMILAGYIGMQATQQTRLKNYALIQQLPGLKPVKPYSDIRPEALPRVRALTQSVQTLQSTMRLPDHALMMLQQALLGIQYWQLMSIEWSCDWLTEKARNESLNPLISACQETLTVAWSNVVLNDEASMEWQKIVSELRSHPEVEQLELGPSNETVGSAQKQGGTRQVLSTAPVLKLYLRRIAEASN